MKSDPPPGRNPLTMEISCGQFNTGENLQRTITLNHSARKNEMEKKKQDI